MNKKWLATGFVTIATLALTATSALAATAPTLSRGARGQDVATLQRLLTHGGQPIAVTALYGPTTEQFVRQFQAKRGLTADGIVGPATWAALQPVLRQGATGPAVQALQAALKQKHQYSLAVDGVFGPNTAAAVRAFQAHKGLAVDGVVGPQTWTALTAHFEPLPNTGPGWYRYYTSNTTGNWGTSHTIATLKQVLAQWNDLGTGMRIGVGDISLQHGGPIPGHASHQKGYDVDFRIMRADGKEIPVWYWDAAYSRSLTQKLVNLLQATGEIEVIFFNDPQIKGVTAWPGHDSHMHVRFKR